MGTWKSCLPAQGSPAATLRRRLLGAPLAVPQGAVCVLTLDGRTAGESEPPATVPDPMGGGLAQHLPLLLRGITGLGPHAQGIVRSAVETKVRPGQEIWGRVWV